MARQPPARAPTVPFPARLDVGFQTDVNLCWKR